jgi:predicted aspartyl protease
MNINNKQIAYLATIVFTVVNIVFAQTAQHSGLPMPQVKLLGNEVRIPFTVDPNFPVPVIQVKINGQDSARFVVDTGMSGTILVRKELADSMKFNVIGHAMVGDASHKNLKKVQLIAVDSLIVGELVISNIVSITMDANADHIASVPNNLDGILGMQLFSNHILTIDYPNKEIILQKNLSDNDSRKDFIPYNYDNNAIEISVDVSNQNISLLVDTGHRGTITLPKSYSEKLPLSETLQPFGKMATVTNTYTREKSKINGLVILAGNNILNPPVVFADEHSPNLLGFGILEHFRISIDQLNKLIRFSRESTNPISDVKLITENIL